MLNDEHQWKHLRSLLLYDTHLTNIAMNPLHMRGQNESDADDQLHTKKGIRTKHEKKRAEII